MTLEVKKRIDDINHGVVPNGYKKTKVGIVPKEWEVAGIGAHLEEFREISNDIDKYPVYSSSRKGLIPQSDYYDQKEATQTNLGYKIVPEGYATYRHMSDDDIFHFNINDSNHAVLVSNEYPVFTTKNGANLYFIISSLNDTSRFRQFCRSQKLGGTRTRLYYKNLITYHIAFPSSKEQQKIASILITQDKLISLQEQKVEFLKKLKKAYLEKMFPKKGSKYPEYRFKGFTDTWEQRKLGDCLSEITYGFTNPMSDTESGPWKLTAKDIVNGKIDYNSARHTSKMEYDSLTDKSKPIIGDLLLTKDGTLGRTAIVNAENICINQSVALLRFNEKCSVQYAKTLLDTPIYQKQMLEDAGGGTIKHIYITKVDKMLIPVPPKKEQDLLVNYFDALDSLITLHQRKLEAEKKKKKALMQLLLTGKVRV